MEQYQPRVISWSRDFTHTTPLSLTFWTWQTQGFWEYVVILQKVFFVATKSMDASARHGPEPFPRSKSGQACAFVRYSNQVEANNAIAAMAQGYEIRPGEGVVNFDRLESVKQKKRWVRTT